MSKKKITYRTFDEIVEERFREHPEEIAGFLETVLEEYDRDQDKKALLVALRQVAKANGRIMLPDAVFNELFAQNDLPR